MLYKKVISNLIYKSWDATLQLHVSVLDIFDTSTPKCLSTLFSIQLMKLHIHVRLLLTHFCWLDPH